VTAGLTDRELYMDGRVWPPAREAAMAALAKSWRQGKVVRGSPGADGPRGDRGGLRTVVESGPDQFVGNATITGIQSLGLAKGLSLLPDLLVEAFGSTDVRCVDGCDRPLVRSAERQQFSKPKRSCPAPQ
jgi:hypothetical protein